VSARRPCKWPPSPVERGLFCRRAITFFFLHGAVSEPHRLHKLVVAFRNLCPKGKSTNIGCTGVSSLPVRRLFVQALRGARFFEKVAHGRMGSRYFPLPAFCTLGRLPCASVDRRLPSERVLRGKRAGERRTPSTTRRAGLATAQFRRGALQAQTRSRPKGGFGVSWHRYAAGPTWKTE